MMRSVQQNPQSITLDTFTRMLRDPDLRPLLKMDLTPESARSIAASPGLTAHYYSIWSRAQQAQPVAPPPALAQYGAPPAVQSEAPRRNGVGCFGGFMIVLVIVIAGIVVANVIGANSRSESSSQSSGQSQEQSAAQSRDETATADGWQVAESGELYVKAAAPGTFTCGSYDCLWYSVHSISGCSQGAYVKADILSGGTAVGWTNAITASIAPGETVSVQVEDHQGVADQFRLAEVSCMG